MDSRDDLRVDASGSYLDSLLKPGLHLLSNFTYSLLFIVGSENQLDETLLQDSLHSQELLKLDEHEFKT